jgi:carotenoid cleavage dioxygenase-like enzyme
VKVGKRRIRFDKETPSRFGIVPRHGGAVRWFETDSCYAYHTVNAWEEETETGTVVHVTACRIEDPIPTTPHETEVEIPRLTFLRLQPYFHHWTFHLGTGAVTSTQLDDQPTEFPRMNDDWLGRKNRYSWNPRVAAMPTLAFDGLIKYDAEGGSTFHAFGGQVGGEAVFVPRPGGTAEDDGWMVGFTHDRAAGTSELRVVDAATMDAEPVARVVMPRRVPFGFHAAWVPGAEIGANA